MSYLTSTTTTTTTNFELALEEATSKAFPVIYGIPGSWAAVMEFADEFAASWYASHPTECPPSPIESDPEYSYPSKSTKTYTKKTKTKQPKQPKTKRPKQQPKRKKFRDGGWDKVTGKKKRKSPTKSPRVYVRNDIQNITMIIKNLPVFPKVDDLTEIFEVYGEVDYIKFIKNDGMCSGIGFVTFKTMKGAARAYAALHKISYQGGTVYTEYARGW